MIHLTVETWDYDVFRQNEDTGALSPQTWILSSGVARVVSNSKGGPDIFVKHFQFPGVVSHCLIQISTSSRMEMLFSNPWTAYLPNSNCNIMMHIQRIILKPIFSKTALNMSLQAINFKFTLSVKKFNVWLLKMMNNKVKYAEVKSKYM